MQKSLQTDTSALDDFLNSVQADGSLMSQVQQVTIHEELIFVPPITVGIPLNMHAVRLNDVTSPRSNEKQNSELAPRMKKRKVEQVPRRDRRCRASCQDLDGTIRECGSFECPGAAPRGKCITDPSKYQDPKRYVRKSRKIDKHDKQIQTE